MANVIKIKRSSSTATPASLAEGELAVSFLSGKLFVGNSSAVIPIGGVHSPGTLTANQALVANSTSGINKVIVANLVASFVYANGAFGIEGQVLSANSTGGVFWNTPVSSLDSLTDVTLTSVANNDLLIYDNDSGQWENHTLSGTASQVNVAFSSQNITISLPTAVVVNSSLTVGNSTVNSAINSTAVSTNTSSITGGITVGSNVSINTSTIFIGNSTVNTTIQAGNIALQGTQLTVGNTLFDGTQISIGNSTVNTTITSTAIDTDGTLAVLGLTNLSGNVNTTTANASVAMNVGANVNLTTSAINVGNSTVNSVIQSTSANLGGTLSVAGNTNISGYVNVVSTANIGGNVTARGSVTVNGALTVANTAGLGNTTVTGFVNATVTVSVGANVIANTTALLIGNSTVNTVINSTNVVTTSLSAANATLTGDLDVQGNTKLGNSISDVVSIAATVNTHIIPSANLTYRLGNNTLYWSEVHTGNVHADYGYFEHDVAIYGDLTVAGNLVTTNVQSVVISDPMIYLAGNNTSSDLVDIGFVGNYFQSATSKHAGLIRDASVDQFYLFRGLTQDLEAQLTVNTADPTFVVADLNAFLISGALVSNSLAVTITANTTVNVNITANTLSLSTALAVTSGGTGAATFTSKGIIYGNGTGALQVTAAGTHGKVLQANSTGYPVFDDLDGGTF